MGEARQDGRVLVGYCGVDSGQVMICDPCYIMSGDPSQPGEAWDDRFDQAAIDAQQQSGQARFSYSGCCAVTLQDPGFGQLWNAYGIEVGVAARSGDGDGSYPVYAEVEAGQIKRLTIEFDAARD